MTRIRDQSALTPVSGVAIEYAQSGAVISSSSFTDYVGKEDVFIDNPTTDFKKKSQAGEVIITDMEKWKTERNSYFIAMARHAPKSGGGTYQQYYHSSIGALNGVRGVRNYLKTQTAFLTKTSDLETVAITDAFAGVGKSSVEALVSLGELPETLGFLLSPVKKMVSVTSRSKRWLDAYNRTMEDFSKRMKRWKELPAYKRKNSKPPSVPRVKPLRVGNYEATDLASFWLMYRYAIMPLVYEYQDWCKYFEKKLTQPPERETSRATSDGDYSKTWEVNASNTTWNFKYVNVLTAQITARAGVLYNPLERTVENDLGLKLHRLPAAGYELIPLSFVADWLWNGAAYYDALTASCRAEKLLGAWVTVTVDATYQMEAVSSAKSPYTLVPEPNGTVYTEHCSWTWRKPVDFSDAGIRVRVKLNAKRIADGLALIATFMRSRR